jgi:hypothetical protein
MLEGGENRLPGPLEQLREGGISGQIAAQDDRIDEVPHRAGEP